MSFGRRCAMSNKDTKAASPDNKPDVDMSGSYHDIISGIRYLERYLDMLKGSGYKRYFIPDTPFSIDTCQKHKAFFEATKDYRQVVFLAGNRVGKTVAGCYFVALSLTGEYPEWWNGRRWHRPIRAWCVGKTAQTTRDTLQYALLGPPGAIGTGMIPKNRIIRTYARSGLAGAIDTVEIEHASGGTSTLGFKSADQGVEAFYGTEMDLVHCDEEVPLNVYNECFVRTMTTNGLVILTFTPLQGITPLIVHLAQNADYVGGATPINIPKAVLESSSVTR